MQFGPIEVPRLGPITRNCNDLHIWFGEIAKKIGRPIQHRTSHYNFENLQKWRFTARNSCKELSEFAILINVLAFFLQWMAFTSLGVVLVSTMTFVLGTFPGKQYSYNNVNLHDFVLFDFMFMYSNIALSLSLQNSSHSQSRAYRPSTQRKGWFL